MVSKRVWWSAGACCVLGTSFLVQHVRGQQTPPAPNLPRIVTNSPGVPVDPPALPPIATPSASPPAQLPAINPGTTAPGSSSMPPSGFLLPDAPPPSASTSPSTSFKTTPPSLPPALPEATQPLPPIAAPGQEPKSETPEGANPLAPQGATPPLPFEPGSGLENPALSELKPGKQEPTVSIEWTTPPSPRLNHPMACQIHVRNNGTAAVHQVVVRHNLLPGVTMKASEPPAKQEQQTLTWDMGSIPAGNSRRIDVTLVPTARGTLTFPATVSFAATTTQQVQIREPLLQIQARAQEKALQGDPVAVVFALSNPGDGATENIKVRAVLPEGLDHPRGRSVEMDIGNLAPKETKTLQMQCVARGAGVQQIILVASADGSLTSQTKASTEVVSPRIDVAAAGPKLRYVERPALYVAKVANPGTAPAAGVVVTQVVPAGFKFQSASAGGRFDEAAHQVVWTLGDLMPGQTREVTVELLPTAAGDYKLPIQAVSSRGIKNETEVRTRVEGVSAIVMEVADTDDPVEVNGETAYEVRVLNAGTKIETNIELVCTLPEQVDLKDARCIAGLKYRVEGRTLVFEPASRLAPKADLIYRVVVRGKAAGDGRFRAQVRAEGMTESVSRDETTRFYRDDQLPK